MIVPRQAVVVVAAGNTTRRNTKRHAGIAHTYAEVCVFGLGVDEAATSEKSIPLSIFHMHPLKSYSEVLYHLVKP